MPRALWWSYGGGWRFLMSEVPLGNETVLAISHVSLDLATLLVMSLRPSYTGLCPGHSGHPTQECVQVTPTILQGYLYYKKPEISKRSVSVSYLGGPIKKLSEHARCPFVTY